MKKAGLVVLLLAAAAVLVALYFRAPTPSTSTGTNGAGTLAIQSNRPASPAQKATGNLTAVPAALPTFKELGSNDTNGYRMVSTNVAAIPPQAIVATIRSSIRQYGDMFGGNPVGVNSEITSALNGNNPKKINFLDAQAGMRINGQGELVDSWGTPLFFHQISGTEMEIHSAGPDRVMWTADDIVAK